MRDIGRRLQNFRLTTQILSAATMPDWSKKRSIPSHIHHGACAHRCERVQFEVICHTDMPRKP